MPDILLWIIAGGVLLLALLQSLLFLQMRGLRERELETQLEQILSTIERIEKNLRGEQRENREEIRAILKDYNQSVLEQLKSGSTMQAERGERLEQNLRGRLQESADNQRAAFDDFNKRLERLTKGLDERAEQLRKTLEKRLEQLQQSNEKRLDQMRATVDEKLQSTLEKRLAESFQKVSKSLENVYETMGEMKRIGTDVSDFKRILTNVKTRGTWGEIQLGALLEQVLAAEQFARNVKTNPNSSESVEFCIKLPGKDDANDCVWLPIDAKFPKEDYERLVEAAAQADQDAVEAAAKSLERSIRKFAKDIKEKYLNPPETTDFAILFLPGEGLYAEVLRRPGLAEALQLEHRVVLAGPTTLVALLNSLQMGFRTLALQKRSSEVWKILGAVKLEFGKFGDVLVKLKRKLEQATNDVGRAEVRTRAMARQLRRVEELPLRETARILDLEEESDPEPEEDGATKEPSTEDD